MIRVYGWTASQWQKAFDYRDQLCARLPTQRDFYATFIQMGSSRKLDELIEMLEVQRFWNNRRVDQPGESTLIYSTTYRARTA